MRPGAEELGKSGNLDFPAWGGIGGEMWLEQSLESTLAKNLLMACWEGWMKE